MFSFIIEGLVNFIIFIVTKLSYGGVFLAMAIQSACIPLPSEVILPFSGFLVSQGYFSYWPTVIAATLGAFCGSILTFLIGFYKGEVFVRQLIKKYGKYLLIFEYELDEAEKHFRQYGEIVTFVSRLLPVVRTFIALPAGISKMKLKKFLFFVISGDFLWSMMLVYVGKVLGKNWSSFKEIFRKFDYLVVLIGVLAVIWYIRHKLKKHNKRKLIKNKKLLS